MVTGFRNLLRLFLEPMSKEPVFVKPRKPTVVKTYFTIKSSFLLDITYEVNPNILSFRVKIREKLHICMTFGFLFLFTLSRHKCKEENSIN